MLTLWSFIGHHLHLATLGVFSLNALLLRTIGRSHPGLQ